MKKLIIGLLLIGVLLINGCEIDTINYTNKTTDEIDIVSYVNETVEEIVLEPYYIYYDESNCEGDMRCKYILHNLNNAVDYYNEIYNGTLFKITNSSHKADIIAFPLLTIQPLEHIGLAHGSLLEGYVVEIEIGFSAYACSTPLISIHELGHALGLEHTFGAGETSNIMYGDRAYRNCYQYFDSEQIEHIKSFPLK